MSAPHTQKMIAMEFRGQFETHITLALGSTHDLTSALEWAQQRNLGFHHIMLDRGTTPNQPMISRHSEGTFTTELSTANALARQLETDGYQVNRVKLEASPENDGIPVNDAEAIALGANRYFEHHVKLRLPQDVDWKILTALCERHSAHLSRNALRILADQCQERFITQRCYRVGRESARKSLNALIHDVKEQGFAISKTEQEFVVYDSAPVIDQGWIKRKEMS